MTTTKPPCLMLQQVHERRVQIFHLVKTIAHEFDVRHMASQLPGMTYTQVRLSLVWLAERGVLESEVVEVSHGVKVYYTVAPFADLSQPPGMTKAKFSLEASQYLQTLMLKAFRPNLRMDKLGKDQPTMTVEMPWAS